MADIDYDSFMTQLHEAEDCHSLAKKYVTPEVAEKFKGSKTKLGGTLAHCIKPGMLNSLTISYYYFEDVLIDISILYNNI